MLTRSQIQRLATRNHIGMQAQERDYVINRRPEAVATRRELITSEYDDVRPFVATVLTPEHILAEKLRALLVRGKPRDLYDIWLLLHQGVRFDRDLVDAKLELYGRRFSTAAFRAAAEGVAATWDRDLGPLMPQSVAFEDVWPGLEPLIGGGATGA